MIQKDIGFNVAVLLTNLSEHMPHDTRLQTFLELAESVLNYFQPYLGRIEIMGSAKRIERVYFEISESSRTQWEKPQVKLVQLFFLCDFFCVLSFQDILPDLVTVFYSDNKSTNFIPATCCAN